MAAQLELITQTMTCESVAVITRKTGTIVAAHRVGAVSEHIARPVFALVLVWKITSFASEAVVAIAKVVQTDAIGAFWHLWMAVI